MKIFKKLHTKTKIILIIQAICMMAGAVTHIKWICENGMYSRQTDTAFFSTLFWDSLAFLDIAAALLLIIRPKAGILMVLIIITTDVIHNNLVLMVNNRHIGDLGIGMWVTTYWMLVAQLLFMAFAGATFKSNRAEIKAKSAFQNESD